MFSKVDTAGYFVNTLMFGTFFSLKINKSLLNQEFGRKKTLFLNYFFSFSRWLQIICFPAVSNVFLGILSVWSYIYQYILHKSYLNMGVALTCLVIWHGVETFNYCLECQLPNTGFWACASENRKVLCLSLSLVACAFQVTEHNEGFAFIFL